MKLLQLIVRNYSLVNKRFYVKSSSGITSKHTGWFEPDGFDSGLTIYNSICKNKVKLKSKKKGVISWYACGPTVYDSAHIGHACCYIYQDIIRRILEDVFKLNVIMVMGVTDIDDKIIAAAKSNNKDFTSISRHYEKEFFSDLSNLNVRYPTVTARVTDYIPEIIAFINKIIDKDFGYSTPDGSVYFRVDKCSSYGKLYPAESESTEVEDTSGKKSSRDFALWKGAKEGEPSWSAPWGSGRPGWHIECSTIASCLLGNEVDIHSGGIDLMFPHHENEEAQSCCYHDVHQWVNYWIHTGHLRLTGDVKMSKSLKNTISISDFLQKYSSYELRMFCLLTRYRNGIDYSNTFMENAVSVCKKFDNFFSDCDAFIQGTRSFGNIDEEELYKCLNETERSVIESLGNDFDTPHAVSHLLHLISTTNKMLHETNVPSSNVRQPVIVLAAVYNYVRNILHTLGCVSETKDIQTHEISSILNTSVQFRSQVRKAALTIKKDYPKESIELKKMLLGYCDDYRKDMLSDGIEFKDHGQTTTWNILQRQRN